ncbi:HAMP domain-containing histidine kinase [Reichenbachiella agarivorans]|uniref:histidine kinase n=1 Tax=Reichenbachiella agarivorans TaxID=2979464 RepID=A0ABY6CSH3_9BACT|nr:HAMP domain-containing sensor histidine kinase [Reichenbachiella agarivorans]UXP33472.1 HAMP domain-containing histidine kinase [Reichenbachiella agarivorans]
MSKSFINTWSLQFHDDELEAGFRLFNIRTEIRYVKYFLILLVLFNGIYAIKDYYFFHQRHIESILWQVFVFIPLYLLFIWLVTRMEKGHYIDRPYLIPIIIFFFTILSQLWLIKTSGNGLSGIHSIMLLVVFGSFVFSGIMYGHSLILAPITLLGIILAVVFFDDSYELVNTTMLYIMTLSGLTLTKYQIERQNRLSFNRTELLAEEDTRIKESYLRVNSLSEMRKDLIAILAHDVRSPLASLHGVLELAKGGDLTQDETMEYIGKIETQVSTVNFLINDILIWIKSQSDEADFEKGPVNISSVVEDLKFLFSEAFEEKEILFRVNLEVDDVFGQPDMIKSILRNFISNAVKFSSKDDTITLQSVAAPSNKVRISVIDEGVGISPQDLVKLKSTFATKLGTKNEKGIGLGLKICRALILAHKSSLEVQSEVNKGTVMSFELNRA